MTSLLIGMMSNRILLSDWLVVERIGNWDHKRRAIETGIIMKWFELDFGAIFLFHFFEGHIHNFIVFKEFLFALE